MAAVPNDWYNTGTAGAWNNSIMYNVDFGSDTISYVQGAERQPISRRLGQIESAEEWLDRRVNEVRVKL